MTVMSFSFWRRRRKVLTRARLKSESELAGFFDFASMKNLGLRRNKRQIKREKRLGPTLATSATQPN